MELTLAQRERRLARARAATFVEMSLATMAVLVALLAPLVAPRTLFPTVDQVVGTLGVVIGYLWLLWLRFRGPEDGAPTNWRSH